MKTPQNRLHYVEDQSTGFCKGYLDYDVALSIAKHLGLGAEAIHSTEPSRVSTADDEEFLEVVFEELKKG